MYHKKGLSRFLSLLSLLLSITIYLRFTKTVFRLYQLKVNRVVITGGSNLCEENDFSL